MEPFIGQIQPFGFNFAPRGWALCDGQLLPISSNTALFSLLGTTFGGDGRTTFGLPDLRGRVPGVDVSTSNEITIRGFNTVNGSTTPLFIVNGVQVSQDIFGNIVPMQIQKITILKGPDAAAYGSRGANGVIVVDTN